MPEMIGRWPTALRRMLVSADRNFLEKNAIGCSICCWSTAPTAQTEASVMVREEHVVLDEPSRVALALMSVKAALASLSHDK